MEDYEQSGCSWEATTDEEFEHSLIMCVRRSLPDIARQIGLSFGAVQYILNDTLGKSKISAIWVPRMLTKDQKSEQAWYF